MSSTQAIDKYVEFVGQVLEPKLKNAVEKKQQAKEDISEYEKLLELIQNTSETDQKLKTLVDIGKKYHVRAKISNLNRIYVDIGLGFHVEMTREEVTDYVPKKVSWLRQLETKYLNEADQISTHIQQILVSVQTLQALS